MAEEAEGRDTVAEASHKVFAKCAWRLIPFMMLLYVVSFLDRANVSFAALTMNENLGFSPSVFGFGAGCFSSPIPYASASNRFSSRFGARRVIFCIMAILVFSRRQMHLFKVHKLLRAAFSIRIAEAGLFPGMILYLLFGSHRPIKDASAGP